MLEIGSAFLSANGRRRFLGSVSSLEPRERLEVLEIAKGLQKDALAKDRKERDARAVKYASSGRQAEVYEEYVSSGRQAEWHEVYGRTSAPAGRQSLVRFGAGVVQHAVSQSTMAVPMLRRFGSKRCYEVAG